MRSILVSILTTVLFLGGASIGAAQDAPRRLTFQTLQLPVPPGVTVTPVAEGVVVSWGAVTGVLGYQVLKGADSVTVVPWGGVGTTMSVTDGSLVPGSVVYFRVAAVYGNGMQGTSGAVAYNVPQLANKVMLSTGGMTLKLAAPTRAPPAGVAVAAAGVMVARLTWPAITGATGYGIYRTDASGAVTGRVPAGFTGTTFVDTVPDPRQAYTYKVSVSFPDNAYGESAPVTFQSPPAVNPQWVKAIPVAATPGSVDLTWERPAGPSAFEVRGPGIPTGAALYPGAFVRVNGLTSGVYAWRVASSYPFNFRDTTTAKSASAIVRTLPRHGVPWLSRPTGGGDQITAVAHAQALCDRNTVGCGRERADSAVQRLFARRDAWVDYHNKFDFAQNRRTWCNAGKGNSTVCWAENNVTITMIVTSSSGTQFLAYEEAEPGIWRQTITTQVDGEGRKFVPFSCMSCHGGTYDPNTRLVQGATLLPIDPSLVQLTGRECYRGIGASDEDLACIPAEGTRVINALVYASSTNPAVRRYVYGLYGGRVSVTNATALQDYVPQSWLAQNRSFYLDVLRPNCVMCHLGGPPTLDFTTQTNFFGNAARVHSSVCVNKSMPHAEVPFKKFWTEDTGNIWVPGMVATILGFPSCQ